MKRFGIIFLTFIAAVLLGMSLSVCGSTKREQAYAVVVPVEAEETERCGAEILSGYLSALTGENCPILEEGQAFEGFCFYVGSTSAADAYALAGERDGSYDLVPVKDGLAIYGAGNRGTLYGVYGYLEDFCGYRCFTAASGMQSRGGKITVPEAPVKFRACFEYTDTDWRSPYDVEYSLANGLNGVQHRALTARLGGGIGYLGGFCHTLSTIFCAADTYFQQHPEYFALHEGKRVPGQLCLTNEDVYQIVLSEVMELLKNYHVPEATLQIISLTQNDNQLYCQCDSCRALDDKNGSQAGTVITFANRVARAVREAGYDNIAIDTFAYQYSRKAPSEVVPEENVIVRLCTIEGCFSHPLNDPACPLNAELMQDLEAWNRICDRLYIWDYTNNYSYTCGIFPDFHVLQANMQCFYEHGVRGVYEEGNYYIEECDTEFGELRSYLISRLLRDPYCDYEKEMDLFCRAFYGDGGPYIREFIDKVTDRAAGNHATIYTSMRDSFSISEEEAGLLDSLWVKAAEVSGKDPAALAAVERSRLSWRYVKACLALGEFKDPLENSMQAREDLYRDLISHGVRRLDEWHTIKEDFEAYRYIPVEGWIWADIIHILFYDANGGTGAPLSQWSDGYIEVSEQIPVREGYSFLGWSSDPGAEQAQYLPRGAFMLTGDLTLFAVWEKEGQAQEDVYR